MAQPAYAGTAPEKPVSVYDSAMLLLINQKYSPARKILTTHIDRHPGDMKARYFLFAAEQTRILDYESYVIEVEKFQRMADSNRAFFEERIKELAGPDSTECLFYLANVYGGIGVMQAKTGSWFDGVKNAVTSVSMLKVVKERDSSFYAADLGLGIFHYYLSTSLKWLPFVDNKEKEGLAAIERAVEADFPYNYAAKNSLCWILIERGNFRRADSIAQAVISTYPGNTIFLRIKALIALWTGKYAEGIRYGKKLAEITERREPLNWSDLVAGYTVIVQSNYKTGRKKEACRAADYLLEKKIPGDYLKIPHIRKNLKYIRKVRQKCQRSPGK